MLNNSNQSDFAIFIGHADYEPWATIVRNGPINTWLKNEIENVYYFSGKKSSPIIRRLDMAFWNAKWDPKIGRIAVTAEFILQKILKSFRPNYKMVTLSGTQKKLIEFQMPDLNILYAHKTINLLHQSLALEWKYFVSVTSSSYINMKALKTTIAGLPNNNCVAGRIISQGSNLFPCGTFRIFSRDVVELIVRNRDKYPLYLPEDLALGKLIVALNLEQIEISSLDIPNLEAITKFTFQEIENVPHFRCKSGTHIERQVVNIMLELHARLTG
jgi:hypothetical protein